MKEISKKSLPIIIPLYIIGLLIAIDICFKLLRQPNTIANLIALVLLILVTNLTYQLTKKVLKK